MNLNPWQQALTAYDAHLADDGRIVRKGKTLGVSVRPRHLPCRSDQAHSHAP